MRGIAYMVGGRWLKNFIWGVYGGTTVDVRCLPSTYIGKYVMLRMLFLVGILPYMFNYQGTYMYFMPS